MSCSYVDVFTSKHWLPDIERCLQGFQNYKFHQLTQKKAPNSSLWLIYWLWNSLHIWDTNYIKDMSQGKTKKAKPHSGQCSGFFKINYSPSPWINYNIWEMKNIKRNKSSCLPDRWQQIGRYCLHWASKIHSLVACRSIWGAWLQNAPCTNTLPLQTEASWVEYQKGFFWNGSYLARYTACFMSCSAFLNSRFTTQAWAGEGKHMSSCAHTAQPLQTLPHSLLHLISEYHCGY